MINYGKLKTAPMSLLMHEKRCTFGKWNINRMFDYWILLSDFRECTTSINCSSQILYCLYMQIYVFITINEKTAKKCPFNKPYIYWLFNWLFNIWWVLYNGQKKLRFHKICTYKRAIFIYYLYYLFRYYMKACKIRSIIIMCNYFYVRLLICCYHVRNCLYYKQKIEKLMNLYDAFYIL